ncbi:alpha/beta hydrolase [Mycobacterium sp. NPDC006124]|uniref:alpha/beta hydrolase n=1 Tax=Mycobacterium sp. NPDC006124 TaxID=3156729 RepID=UPI0033BF9D10
MSSPARPNPSMASHLVAATARRVLRPLTQVIPANQHGLAVMDRVLRGTLVVSRPRPGISVEKVDTLFAGEHVRGDWIKAANVVPDAPPILYIHGGAFSMCSPETHRGLISELSAAARRPVFAVRYRLAPRHPFPAAAEDALTAYRWLTEKGTAATSSSTASPGTVALAGDSAGGQLAAATAIGAREHRLPAPDAMLLMSPVLDLTCHLAIDRDRRRRDPFASAISASRTLGLYVRGADPADPRVSVLDADLTDMPPTLIQVGGREMLLDDSRVFADRLQAAGVSSQLQVFRGQIHVFQAMFRLLPEAREALRLSGEFLATAATVR